MGPFITRAEVTVAAKQLCSDTAPGVDGICPEYLKALDVEGLSWQTHLCNTVWMTGTEPLE